MTDVQFLQNTYTQDSLSKMSEEELLNLRNLVAENLGVARIKSFKNIDQARDGTWKALMKFHEASQAEAAGEEVAKAVAKVKEKKAAKPKEPKEPQIVKAALPGTVKRPTRAMFRKIQKISTPDRGLKRWENYQDGMTILDTIEGEGVTHLDVTFYVNRGNMKLIEPTEEEYQAGVNSWCERNGVEHPDIAKARLDKEREALKAEKAEVRAKELAEHKLKNEATKAAKLKMKAQAAEAAAAAKAALLEQTEKAS